MADKADIQAINDIENKYGLVLFRMGLTHLMDVGHRNLGDEAVEDGIVKIMSQGEKDKANGKLTILTPEYLCDVLRCATGLTRFSVWTLFAYIKKHVAVE